jgi:hypothetical protein
VDIAEFMQRFMLVLACSGSMPQNTHIMSHITLVTADAKKPWRPCRKARALGL